MNCVTAVYIDDLYVLCRIEVLTSIHRMPEYDTEKTHAIK